MSNTYEHEVLRRYWEMDPTVTRADALAAAEKLGLKDLQCEKF